MSSVVWVGSKNLELTHEEDWEFSDHASVTVCFTGPFSKCVTERPARGTAVPGYAGLSVDSCRVKRLAGGAGELRVALVSPAQDESDFPTDAVGEPTFEIDFQELSKRIEEHPKCGKITEQGIGKGLTWDDWPKFTTGDYFAPDTPANAWLYDKYQEIRGRGVEDFLVPAPVVRRTTYHFRKPADLGANCFERENPPVDEKPSGYEWLKGPDRCLKSGRFYERTTEWWGAKEWDADVYD